MNNLKTRKKLMPIALIALLSVAIIGIVIFNTAHKDVAFASEATNASASSDASSLGNTSEISVTCYQWVGNKNERPYTATFTWDAGQNGYALEVKTPQNNDGGVDVNEGFFNNIFTEVQKKGLSINKNSVFRLRLVNGQQSTCVQRNWYGKLWTHAGAINGWEKLTTIDSEHSSDGLCKIDTVDAFKNTKDAKPYGRSAENAVICNCPNLKTVDICVASSEQCLNNASNYLISNCIECNSVRIEDFSCNFAKPGVLFSYFDRVISGVKHECKVHVHSFWPTGNMYACYDKTADRWPDK